MRTPADHHGDGSGHSHSNSAQFRGTENPRHIRVLEILVYGWWVSRENIDRVAGCSNGPHLIAQLRRLGLDIPCWRRQTRDRDGRRCYAGMYRLTKASTQQVDLWLSNRGRE